MILRFSGLSVRDHVELLSTKLAQRSPTWDCEKCQAKFTPEVRAARGCEKPADQIVPLGGKYRMAICPGNFHSEWALSMFELYNLFKMGFLPYKGTVTEQPAKIMEAFAVISDMENEEEKQRAAEMKRAQRGK